MRVAKTDSLTKEFAMRDNIKDSFFISPQSSFNGIAPRYLGAIKLLSNNICQADLLHREADLIAFAVGERLIVFVKLSCYQGVAGQKNRMCKKWLGIMLSGHLKTLFVL